MRMIRRVSQMQRIAVSLKQRNKRIGFVPTMGALHEGHLSLIRAARAENDTVVASIFVNPVQFGPREDFSRYPRPFKKDSALCKVESVDILFCPSVEEMYPAGYKTYVSVDALSESLCGKSRPGHFKGVTTVVAKLFNSVLPDRAYFGAKDAQQAVIIKKMVQDLNFPVDIKVLPTLREPSGLALSSRNQYLSKKGKEDAVVLSQSLLLADRLVKKGQRSSLNIIRAMKDLIAAKKSVKVDYVEIVDPATLLPLKKIQGSCLLAIAAKVGKTRLIDNILIHA